MPLPTRSFFLSLLIVQFAMSATEAADRKPFLAISPLQAKKVDPDEVDLISDALSGELQNSGAFRVMERSQMDRILKEQGLQTSGVCDGNECAVEVGKVLGIDRIVVGSVGKIGSLFIINVRMVDVTTGEILASVRRTQEWEMKYVLTKLVPEVAKALSEGYHDDQKVEATPVPAATAEAAPVTPTPPPSAPTPTPAPAVAKESSGSSLPLILGGAALVGGGVAAYFLLADKDSKSSSSDNGNTVSIPVTW